MAFFSESATRLMTIWSNDFLEDSGAYNQSVGSQRTRAKRGEAESASASLSVQFSQAKAHKAAEGRASEAWCVHPGAHYDAQEA
jgi:hypothetical protein